MADTPNADPRFTWSQGDVRPIPDPTVLTGAAVTAAKEDLRREMESWGKILAQRVEDLVHRVDLVSSRVDDLPKDSESRLAGLRETLLQYLSSTDRAVALLQDEIRQVFAQIGIQVGGLRDLHKQVFDERFNSLTVKMDERFAAIDTQFSLRDTRVTATAQEVKEAMANTLIAQSRLVDQQNTSFAQALSRIEATAQKQIEQVLTLAQSTSAASDSKHNDLKDRVALIEGRSAGIGSSWGVLMAVLGFLAAGVGIAVAVLKGS